MKLSDYKQTYYDLSGTASTVNRQLAFAGIAFLWLFKIDKGGYYCLPYDLFMSAVLLIMGLGCDLLHYVVGSIIWGWFFHYKEWRLLDKQQDPDADAPFYLLFPTSVFFVLKLLLVIFAYLLLLKYSFSFIKIV
jgi:hypothetical protein